MMRALALLVLLVVALACGPGEVRCNSDRDCPNTTTCMSGTCADLADRPAADADGDASAQPPPVPAQQAS